MLVREETIKQFVKRYFGPTLAAAALMSGAGAARAQFNQVNTFNPAGPTVLQPLGGGVLSNLSLGSPANTFTTGFGSTLGTGFGSFNNGFNQGFVLPLNQPFNNQLNAFNQQRVLDTSGFSNFNTQLADFNAQRTAFNQQFIQQNSALNVPNLNVPGSSNVGVFTGFVPTPTITNPSLNPASSTNSSFGFSAFNTFNPLNNTTFVPITAGMLSTQNFVNSQAAAQASRTIGIAANGVTAQASSAPFPGPWPVQPMPGTISPTKYILSQQSPSTPFPGPWPVQPTPGTYSPTKYILGQQAQLGTINHQWVTQPAPSHFPPFLYMHSPMGVGTGMAARSAFGAGLGTSAVVMGGRR